MEISSSCLSRAAALCREVAPIDLQDRAVYIVSENQWRAQCPEVAPNTGMGWTNMFLDIGLKSYLESRGEWQGRGFACVLCDPQLDDESEAIAITLHELAHGMDDASVPLATTPISNISPVAQALIVDTVSSQTWPRKPGLPRLPRWHAHEASFIRAAIHLRSRASNKAGRWISPWLMGIAGPRYGVSDYIDYSAALGNEPHELAELSFAEILKLPPPEEFTRLWESDTAAKPNADAA